MRNIVRIIAAVVLAIMSIAGIGGVAVAAPAGSITGYVHADSGTPINGAHVVAYNWDTGMFVGEDHARPNGTYSITGLPSGSYRVKADYTRYLPEYYNEGTVTLVSVTDPNATPDVNFTLTPGSSISGHVYHDDGTTPLPTAHVVAYENVTVPGTWTWLADGYSGADGFYTIATGTGAGTYRVKAVATGYAAEYYHNVSDPAAFTPVTVTAGDDTPGIDFTLTQVGYISGTVCKADGVTPISTAQIVAYDSATGNWVDDAYSGASAGYYYINLPPGTYRLMAKALGYTTQWYVNVTTFAAATPVSVVGLKETPNRNFTLKTLLGVTTNDASNLATTSATLNGDLTGLGTAASVTVSFVWGTTAGGPYVQETTPTLVKRATGAFSFDLSSLTPGTTYYYKAKAVGDNTVYGAERSFAAPTTSPSVTTDSATDVWAASARLNGKLTTLGTKGSVTVSFLWGTTAGGPYPNETGGQERTAAGAFFADLRGLGALTKYYYKVKAVGDGTVYGGEKSFTTIDVSAPEISSVGPSSITVSGVTITWTTNELATSQVEYGLTEKYGSITTFDSNPVNSHSVDLAGLKAGKTYHYRVISKDAASNRAVSRDDTFTTAARSGAMPTWAWAIVGLAAVGVVCAVAFLIRGKLAKQ